MAYEDERRTKHIKIYTQPLEIDVPMECTDAEIEEFIDAEIEGARRNGDVNYDHMDTIYVCWYCKINEVGRKKEGQLCPECTKKLVHDSA